MGTRYGIRITQQGALLCTLWVFPRLPGAIVQSTERAGNPTTQTTRPFDWLSNGPVPALALRQRLPETAKRTLLPLFCHFLPSCLISVHKGRPDRSQTDGAVRTRPRRRRRPRGPNQASTRPARDTRGRADSAERGPVCCVVCTEYRRQTPYSLHRGFPRYSVQSTWFQITNECWPPCLFPANFSLADPRKPPPNSGTNQGTCPSTTNAPHQPSRSLHRQMFYSCPARPLLPKMPQLHHRQR